MSSHVLISHAPEDREVANYLAGDLERQGVRAVPGPGDEQSFYAASAQVTILGPASATSPSLRADAQRAAAAGKPIHVVRLADVGGEVVEGLPVRGWTDAFGEQAQGNVARLAQELRGFAGGGAPGYGGYGAPQPPYGPAPRNAQSKGLAIAGGVIGVIALTFGALSLAGVFDRRSSRPMSSYNVSGSYGGNLSGSGTGKMLAASGAAGGATSGSLRYEWIHGTWGPGCPNSRTGAVTLNNNIAGGGSYSSAQGGGSWVINAGNTLTTYDAQGRKEDSIWTPRGANSATVNVPGIGTRTLYRC